jgi:GDP-D-mannose dehydratase
MSISKSSAFYPKLLKNVLNSCRWRGSGEEEEGIDEKTGHVLVKVDTRYFRPAEVE